MFDVFSRVISEADARGVFVSDEEINRLKAFAAENLTRIEIINLITVYSETIVTSAARDLFAEQPQLVQPGGNAYTTRRFMIVDLLHESNC